MRIEWQDVEGIIVLNGIIFGLPQKCRMNGNFVAVSASKMMKKIKITPVDIEGCIQACLESLKNSRTLPDTPLVIQVTRDEYKILLELSEKEARKFQFTKKS